LKNTIQESRRLIEAYKKLCCQTEEKPKLRRSQSLYESDDDENYDWK
jgi:hypothetical protein